MKQLVVLLDRKTVRRHIEAADREAASLDASGSHGLARLRRQDAATLRAWVGPATAPLG